MSDRRHTLIVMSSKLSLTINSKRYCLLHITEEEQVVQIFLIIFDVHATKINQNA